MELKQISPWTSIESIESKVDASILSWLSESGPITNRIKLSQEFELELLNDEIDEISKEEELFLNSVSETFRVRRVILLGNNTPVVYAKSVIPSSTIENGLSSLGKIGNAPLGDILFTPGVFTKLEMVCASFLSKEKNIYWGRKIKYSVNSEPISVMEVFLI
ncbi:MAG: chorismate--pyruvate lyase [Gammaproteobacteria bacterium]|jgi:chorismate--pyruvate lyase|nr:chorismate--pyruvate lyase [Gammaproteobacteria bacterium]MAV17434.1 chorismate--pyruvate lyase [Gammaproteobacteria bacterium]|tara:strand:- start:989 stop:1474 length:486 start_codon:yes stop_codon:yes gene_type:complete